MKRKRVWGGEGRGGREMIRDGMMSGRKVERMGIFIDFMLFIKCLIA